MVKTSNNNKEKETGTGYTDNDKKVLTFSLNVADQVPVKLWITDENGACIFLNKKWLNYTGQEYNAALGFGWLEAVHPEEKKKIKKAYLSANTSVKPFELEYRLRNAKGEYRWHIDRGEPNYDNGHFRGYIGVLVDIHEHKMAENILAEIDVQYKTYVEAMPQMAFIADPQGNIIYYNQRWYSYIKNKKGTEGWGWKEKKIHHPDDLNKTIDRWNYSLKSGIPYEIEYRLLRHDGEYRWHLGRANPISNKNGEITLWLGTNTDIHEQKTAEEQLRKANTELKEKNNRLEQLRKLRENLLHIISHDLKGPLGNMQLALDIYRTTDKEEVKEQLFSGLIKMVNEQTKVVDGLSEIISVQHSREVLSKQIQLREVLQRILQEHQSELTNEVDIQYDFNEVPVIQYVESFIYSILKNLIVNAIKYRSTDRKLKVEIRSKRVVDHVLITVKDNGSGIDLQKHKKSLFHAFKRFTDRSSGTGIGLYIVKNLIEGNGGFIEIESQPDIGTTFYCFFKEY